MKLNLANWLGHSVCLFVCWSDTNFRKNYYICLKFCRELKIGFLIRTSEKKFPHRTHLGVRSLRKTPYKRMYVTLSPYSVIAWIRQKNYFNPTKHPMV